MLKSGTQFVVVAIGLSSLALSTGCGRDKQVFDQKLAEVKGAALQVCLDAKQTREGCESGLFVAQQVGRMALPKRVTIRIEGEERVTAVNVESLNVYMDNVPNICHSEATPVIGTDSEGFPRYGRTDASKQQACEIGARALFIEFGKSCGADLARMSSNGMVVCELKREPIQVDVTPVVNTSVVPACRGGHALMCP